MNDGCTQNNTDSSHSQETISPRSLLAIAESCSGSMAYPFGVTADWKHSHALAPFNPLGGILSALLVLYITNIKNRPSRDGILLRASQDWANQVTGSSREKSNTKYKNRRVCNASASHLANVRVEQTLQVSFIERVGEDSIGSLPRVVISPPVIYQLPPLPTGVIESVLCFV